MTARHSRPLRRRVGKGKAAPAAAVGVVATLLVGSGALATMPTARAEIGSQIFSLSAEAVALQSTTQDPAVPLGLAFSVGSYGASSLLNSNGESAADAGAPYSPLISSLPNTGNGVAQSTFGTGLPVVPKFPGYVSAKDPVTPIAKQNAGGYELVATAAPDEARGKVNMGGQAATSAENNAFAFADSIAGEDDVRAEASAGVHALTLEGIFDLANFSSYASLVRTADGRTVPQVRTNLGTINFAGLTSGATGAGLTVLGSEPTPISAEGLDALNAALKPAGITLTYLPEQYTYTDGSTSTGPAVDSKKTVAGVVSGALQIVFTYTADRGTTTETLTVGRVAVNATSSTIAGAAAVPSAAANIGDSTTPSTGVPSGVESAGLALPSVAAGVAPGSGLVGAAPTSGIPTQSFLPAASSRIDPQGMTSFDSLYIVLAIAAGVALLGGQVVRVVAVRLR